MDIRHLVQDGPAEQCHLREGETLPLLVGVFVFQSPVLFSFRTNKGVGYSCQFTGNCLVVNSEKTKGKPISKCIRVGSFRDLIMPQAELTPRKWHHVALAHHYSRWGRSEIKCYLDGQLAETVEMSWFVFWRHGG